MFELDISKLAEFALVLLIPGIVETSKKFGVAGNWSLLEALVLGFVFVALAEAINLGLVPPGAIPWIRVFVMGLGGAVAMAGYYDLFKRWFADRGQP